MSVNIFKEIWLEIPGTNGDYLASNFGRIKSVERHYIHPIRGKVFVEEKILSQMLTNYGYLRCQLSINRVKVKYFVHRLIALAFHENKTKKPCVNHKNGIKTDNRPENLEWVTYSENNFHSYRELGKVGAKAFLGKSGNKHHASKKIYCVTLGIMYESARIAEKELGISQGSISHVCNGKRDNAEGLYFRYYL